MVLSEKELWEKLSNYCLTRYIQRSNGMYAENLDVNQKQIMERSGELVFFNSNIFRSLFLYPIIISLKEENGYINLTYRFYCEMSLISLITSLESYLENNFRKLSDDISLDKLDLRKISDFIREYNLEKKYFEVLKIHGNHEFLLSEIHPYRFNFQQKDKLKSAYKLLGLDLTKIASEKIWKNIFDKDKGYVKLRNRIVHQGYGASLQLAEPIDKEIIAKAALDIAKFIYCLDKEITSKFPKSEYPELYFKEAE